MVRFIPDYLIFSVATIRVYKKIFSSAFSFDKSYIKNKLKESENHAGSQEFFFCKGIYTVSPTFPSEKCADSTLWGKEAELKAVAWSLRQSRWVVWDVEFGTARAARLHGPRPGKGRLQKSKPETVLFVTETTVDSQAMLILG